MTEKMDELLDALDELEIKELEELAMEQLPEWNDVFIREFQRDPELAKECVADELEEYAKTGDIKYLLSTLKDVAAAKGWVWLAGETGLSRPTLYETLNGKRQPRVDTLAKILAALGFRMLFVPIDAEPPKNSPSAKLPQRRRRTIKNSAAKEHLQRA